jgi:Fe-S oxidoreductase
MCPSFKVTREEKHTTRGRAHLLFEMLRGDVLKGGWKSEAVKESLDLCLACKGCKGDCPVSVDVATYKAEFLSHYYEGRLRPRAAYSMGGIAQWARLGARMPGLVNLLTQTPLVSWPVKALAGISLRRRVPQFAGQSFKDWFSARPVKNPEGKPAILWPDTFNNHFEPHTAQAAVEVLEDAGFRVQVPAEPLCCGRPLYDYGLLDQAQQQLREILRVLGPSVEAGVPVVVLEPSCAAVFRDELVNLFPNDLDAQRLKLQTHLLGELLRKEGYQPAPLRRKVVLHGHCHQKALMGLEDDEALLKAAGLEVETLDSGCCGMAGSFGYEREKFDLSMKIGEQRLLPAVRGAAPEALIVTNGFSCRTQIEQGTPRRALHLAEVLRIAKHQRPEAVAGPYPERGQMQRRSSNLGWKLGGLLLLGAGLWWLGARGRRP